MTSIFVAAAAHTPVVLRGRRALVVENLALRQQLAVYRRVHNRPRLSRSNVLGLALQALERLEDVS